MSKIIRVIGFENKGEWAHVIVQLDDGMEGTVWVGGSCETYFHKGRVSVFVKKPTKHIDKQVN